MRIAPPDDSAQVQKLNKPKNEQGAETRPVDELTETARAAPVRKHEERQPRQRQNDRRKGERRKRDIPTTLDTRSHQERRRRVRREEDNDQAPEEKPAKHKGIDLLA